MGGTGDGMSAARPHIAWRALMILEIIKLLVLILQLVKASLDLMQ